METRNRTNLLRPVPGGASALTSNTGERDALKSHAFTIADEYPTPREPGLAWACADPDNPVDPDVFHPTDLDGLIAAQRVCAPCPMRALCRSLGADRKEWGVWGGVLYENGKVRDEPRKAGRPSNKSLEARRLAAAG